MGCEFNFQALPECKTATEAVAAAKALIERAAWEYGHGGYTGSFAECNGVLLTSDTFDTLEAAEEWLDENAEKWGPMLIVRGGGVFCAGANCSS